MSTNTSANQMIASAADRFDIPDDLTAADTKLVYLFVTVSDGVTIGDLQSTLDIKKISLFPVLDTLSERGLIDRVDDKYVNAAA
ncbi:TrmB family transcriptional regulator [Haloplanus litoreus]|uniref:TrmB family transcriptional regulator n=1 Tax=Haloplanus litoreus TaxID=767515 RepID=A0ABD6A022_9EURY